MNTYARLWTAIILPGALGALPGCHEPRRMEPLPPLPLATAARLVNQNLERITGTLRAVGSVDGHVTLADGRRRSFHVSATLFYLAPDDGAEGGPYVRFDLKKLGDTQFLIGSNETRYWYYSKEDESFHCGWHNEDDALSAEIPINPRELVDALGLTRISTGLMHPGAVGRLQRIDRDHQQLLFVVQDDEGPGIRLEKEYWLDRYPPRLIGRVVFPDDLGGIELESSLSDYKPLGPHGPWLPHEMIADWPESGVHLRFRIDQWNLIEQVKRESIQFATPRECAGR